MTTKQLAEKIGSTCYVRVQVGATSWFIRSIVIDTRLRYGSTDYMVEHNGQTTWISWSNVQFKEPSIDSFV